MRGQKNGVAQLRGCDLGTVFRQNLPAPLGLGEHKAAPLVVNKRLALIAASTSPKTRQHGRRAAVKVHRDLTTLGGFEFVLGRCE